MGSDDEHRVHRVRRSRLDDEGRDEERRRRDPADRESHRRRRSKGRDHGRERGHERGSDRHREKRGSRSRERRERRRSRTPDPSSRQRPRSRSRDRSRDRDRERRRRRSTDADGDAGGKELTRHHRRRRHRESSVSDSGSDAAKRKRPAPASPLRRAGPLPDQNASFAVSNGEEPEKPKEKPNLRTTGLLAAASNSVQQADGTSIVLKYHEPAEARKPPAKDQWRLFIFKGADIVDTVDLSARSCWLVGREAAVVDLMAEHPSISKQHAVIQFRHVEKRNEFGDRIGKVKPYLIDLESANGTVLNGDKVADSRYYELRDKDMVKLGHSTREYVIMLAPKE